MKKALIVTTVSGFVPQFEMNNVQLLQSMHYEVHYATNLKNPHYGKDNTRLENTGIVLHQIDFVRSPFKILHNIKAYRELSNVLANERYDVIHCHTPMASALSRLAGRKYKKFGLKIIYTAHGFHFFKGSPICNWLIYYNIERSLAKYTDALITINREDYKNAKRIGYKNVYITNGVGIDLEKTEIKQKVTQNESERHNTIRLISVGELSVRKNHKIIIETLALIKKEYPEIFSKFEYRICGDGTLRSKLGQSAKKLGVESHIIFMGYQEKISECLQEADIFLFPSRQEGLPMAMMEAMSMGLPIIASNIRGNVDLIENGKGGYLVDCDEVNQWMKAILYLVGDKEKIDKMGNYNKQRIVKFGMDVVREQMKSIYMEVLKGQI